MNISCLKPLARNCFPVCRMPNTSYLGGGTAGGSGGALCAGVEVAVLLVGGASLFDFAPPELG